MYLIFREEKLDGVQSRLRAELQQAKKIIADKLPFIDTSKLIYYNITVQLCYTKSGLTTLLTLVNTFLYVEI